MDTNEFSKYLGLEPLYDISNDNILIEGVYIGDLLSIVMSKAKTNYVWITIQTHLNVVAVAELIELSCIIIVENMDVEEETIKKAKELGIPMFRTKESAYKAACKLYDMGVK